MMENQNVSPTQNMTHLFSQTRRENNRWSHVSENRHEEIGSPSILLKFKSKHHKAICTLQRINSLHGYDIQHYFVIISGQFCIWWKIWQHYSLNSINLHMLVHVLKQAKYFLSTLWDIKKALLNSLLSLIDSKP